MTKQIIVDEPLQTNENGDHNDEKQSIWASILRDVKSSTKKAPTTKSLIVLGDNESGRTTLVAKLQGNEDPKRGAGLEYHYIDVKDDDRDDTPKLGVWILDGDAACSAPLLKYAMKPETLENTLLIFVASMTQPWSILSTLVKWTKLIEEHLDRLQIDPTRLREMRDHLQHDFQHYIEANDLSTTIKSNSGGGRVPSSVSPLSPTNGDDQIILPLPDGVLTRSLGIPVIVVITKCDVMSGLEKENDYKDEYFDFMQHHLRKFCLEYGAALVYTSVKEKKNIDKLYKYIVHKCYGYPFSSSAAIIERDAICIPSGWDNPKKADILLENLHRLKSAENYSDVFVKPALRRPPQRDSDIVMAEDDQEFLAKLQLTLNRAVSPSRGDKNQPLEIPPVRPPKQTIPTPDDPTRANQTALSAFFGTLLAKKSGGAATPISASPITQRQTIESPTTPSAKRLQQHPLTFAVTPPPGRSRTPTPTSHKTFPSSLNIESPPKALSPVVEQQSKVEANLTFSASPTIVRTPVKGFNGIEDKQSSNHTPQLEDDLNSNSNTEILNSPSRSSSLLIEHTPKDFLLSHNITSEQSPITEIAENTDQSNDKDGDENRINPIVSHEETSQPSIENISLNHDEQQDNRTKSPNTSRRNSITNERIHSRPSSPVLNESQQQQDQTLTDADAANIHSEQLDRRVSSSDSQQPEILGENLLTDQPSQQPSTSSVNTGDDEQLEQAPISLSDTNNNGDHALSLAESSDENPAFHPEKHLDSPSSTEHHPIIKTTSFDHTPYSPTEDNDLQKSPNHETALSPFHTVQSSQSTTLVESPTFESSDIKSESHEDTTASPTLQDEKSKSRSPSPVIEQQPDRNGSPSPMIQQEQQRSRSPSPINKNEQSRSRSPSPIIQQGQQRSRSPSPINKNEQSRSRSPSPFIQQGQQRSRSPSPINKNEQSRSRSPSPIIQQGQQRSRSPSPINKNEQSRSRSPSPIIQQGQQRSRSPSPINKNEQSRSRSPSPTNKQDQERNQSPSLISEQKQERSRSPSPVTKQEQERSRSSSPTVQQERQRSPSPSLILREERSRSRSPSPIPKQEQGRSRSPSLTTEQDQEQSQSPLLNIEQKQNRSRSSSPVIEQQPNKNRSPSPIIQQEQRRSRSPSPEIEQQPDRNRSPSSIAKRQQSRSRSSSPNNEQGQERNQSSPLISEQKQERSRSPSPTVQQERQRSRSPSPITKEDQQRSRSPSPITEQDQERSQSSLVNIEQKQNRRRSPSLTAKQEQERSQSPSPVIEQQPDRNRSPSPIAKQEQERSRSPSPDIYAKQQRSRSPSPVNKEDEGENRSAFLITVQDQDRGRKLSFEGDEGKERSRSPSPTNERREGTNQSSILPSEEKFEQSRPTSPAIEQNLVQSRSTSPVVDSKLNRKQSTSVAVEQIQTRSRSPSPSAEMKETSNLSSSSPFNENRERSRSPSPNIERKEAQSPTLVSASLGERTERSPLPSPIHDEQHKDSSHIESLAKATDFTEDNGSISQISDDHEKTEIPSSLPKSEGNQLPRLSTDLNDQITHLLQENTDSSSTIRQSKQSDRRQSSSPTDQHETSVTNIKDKNEVSPLLSPLRTSQPLKSPVPEKQESHSIKQRSASDRQHETISPAPMIRRPSITRSKSQSAVVRPNTLHFTPNNHDLDGLYMSNDYDDEDDILDEGEHHYNSAPSTVRVEQRRSSLLYNDNPDRQQKSIDPEDVFRRLSVVEKSRMEGILSAFNNDDHDNYNPDPTNSTST